MFNQNGYSLADVAAATRNDDGFFGGNSSWFIILVLLLLFGWGGNGAWGNSGSGAVQNYVLTSDFASLERQMDNGFDGIRQQNTQIANGISSLGYDQLNQMNGINQNINGATNVLTAQITDLNNQMQRCCCDNKYQSATQAAQLNYRLAEQSCQTRQAVADAASTITAGADANTRSILNAIQSMQTQALQDKINTLTADNNALKFAASQQAQNAYLISALSPSPIPAYQVPNPYTGAIGYRTCGCTNVG